MRTVTFPRVRFVWWGLAVNDSTGAESSATSRSNPIRPRWPARTMAVLSALLLSAAAATALAGPAAAAVPPPPVQDCTAWTQVPFEDINDGYTNDRHGIVAAQV